jgi:hypothetical protein
LNSYFAVVHTNSSFKKVCFSASSWRRICQSWTSRMLLPCRDRFLHFSLSMHRSVSSTLMGQWSYLCMTSSRLKSKEPFMSCLLTSFHRPTTYGEVVTKSGQATAWLVYLSDDKAIPLHFLAKCPSEACVLCWILTGVLFYPEQKIAWRSEASWNSFQCCEAGASLLWKVPRRHWSQRTVQNYLSAWRAGFWLRCLLLQVEVGCGTNISSFSLLHMIYFIPTLWRLQ